MRRARGVLALAAAVGAGAGCFGGELAELGLAEPVRVRGAQFRSGPLPGLPPEDGAPAITPAITIVELANNVVRIGQVGKQVAGRTSTDAVAVAMAFDGLGTGYWVAPVGPRDPTAGNEFTWAFDTSFGWDVPLGPGALEVVAIDAAGTAGRQRRISLCMRPDLPDNGAACDATQAPPDAVLALSWDTNVDLDLWVLTPEGKRVDPSHPTTIGHPPPITPAELAGDGVGILDRDSNGGCRIDAINRESLVWRTVPLPGTYVVYANLADACGQAAVHFSAVLYRAATFDDGGRGLVEVVRQDGRLVAAAANGGRGPGLFLLQLEL